MSCCSHKDPRTLSPSLSHGILGSVCPGESRNWGLQEKAGSDLLVKFQEPRWRFQEADTAYKRMKRRCLKSLKSSLMYLTSVTLHSSASVPCKGGRLGALWSFLMWSLIFCTRTLLGACQKEWKETPVTKTYNSFDPFSNNYKNKLSARRFLSVHDIITQASWLLWRYCSLNPKPQKGLSSHKLFTRLCCRAHVQLKHALEAFTCCLVVL